MSDYFTIQGTGCGYGGTNLVSDDFALNETLSKDLPPQSMCHRVLDAAPRQPLSRNGDHQAFMVELAMNMLEMPWF
jgi:hypothetical protein